VNKYLHRRLGINARSLRYAFITYMLRKKVSPLITAAITDYKNLNMILKYTRGRRLRRFGGVFISVQLRIHSFSKALN